ncbi:pesticin C-terminus-like muramidase [Agaribacter marinus]|uniref:Pesticin C-terminal domain-containing protein n=1 Tax=Agaribacter marinus TaxID=1431249 RepID=A0AA37WK83_9ALTE|nr:pesticin C-terminus-like muramidase [Agaribacter marinus]GLR73112.1 hypothetical protein GCM10007852_40200 [Agaribacter marinus]
MSAYKVTIDYGFIAELEGGNILSGYVPDPENSQSGVTVGVGFDLGARNEHDLLMLALSPDFIQRLSPYLGLKGKEAEAYLAAKPLTITEAQANALNSGAKNKMISTLVERFSEDSSTAFHEIPAKWQTVIASVEFQYGSVQTRCPTFWRCVTSLDWSAAIRELRNFGDRYPSRRHKEADYALA